MTKVLAEPCVHEHAAADKDHMTVEDPLSSTEEEEGSEDEESDGATGSESGDEDDDDGSSRLLKASLEARQAARAAGDHPLQQSFRAAAAQLLEKYATADKKKRKQKEGGAVSTGGKGRQLDDDEEEHGSKDKEEEEEGAGEEEEESQDGSAAGSSAEEDGQEASSLAGSREGEEEPHEFPSSNHTQLGDAQRMDRQRAHAEAQSTGEAHADGDDVNDIPFTIPAPSSYAAFARLAEGQGPAGLGLIIQRIRACNALALATDNRRKLQASTSPILLFVMHGTSVDRATGCENWRCLVTVTGRPPRHECLLQIMQCNQASQHGAGLLCG